MKKVNLRDLYPDVYKTDHFVEVTEDVLETIRAAERAEAAYDRRMYRYKAHYSLDCDNGIENAILLKPQTPEMLLEEKQLREQLYAAVMALPEKQAKRIYARYYLGKMYRYKAHYSLDCDNGIENAILLKPQTPETLLEEKQLREQLYAAVMALPEKQAKRIYARYYLGMRVSEIAAAEDVDPSRVRDSIRRGLKQLAKYF